MARISLAILFLLLIAAVTAQSYDMQVNFTNEDMGMASQISGNSSVVYAQWNIESNRYYDQSQYYTQYYRSSNTDGMIKAFTRYSGWWLGLDNVTYPSTTELSFYNTLSQIASRIADRIYYQKIRSLELQLDAQKRINAEYERRLAALEGQHGINNGMTSECIAYLEVMYKESGISKVSCNNTEWVKATDSMAVSIR